MDQTAYVSLERDQWKDLKDGDCFSLLPAGEVAFRAVVNVVESPENGTVVPAVEVPPPEPQLDPVPVPPSSSAVGDPQTPPRLEPSPCHADPPTSHGSPPPLPAGDSVDDLLFGDAPLQPDTEDTSNNLKTSEADSKGMLQAAEESAPEDGDSNKEERAPEDTAAAKEDKPASEDGVTAGASGGGIQSGARPGAVGSTNKPRVLPRWLASIGTAADCSSGGKGGGGGGGATKKARAPPSKPAKQKVSQSSDPPEDPGPRPKRPPVKVGMIRYASCATKVGGAHDHYVSYDYSLEASVQ